MSDGHFNRSLLPKTDFQSGIKVGHLRACRSAEAAFETVLAEVFPSVTEQQKSQARTRFHEEMELK